jgi:transcriptional regulator GlxA family with amidase domain
MQHIRTVRLTPADMQSIEMAIAYIDKNFRSKISADQLSIEVNLPKEKLQAGFQKKTSLTVHKYVLRIRIEKAKELLINTNSPLKSIASRIGFIDESYFCKVFRRIADTSPMEFRLQQVC